MTEGQKERIKLRAAYYNGVAVAIVAVGGFGFTFTFLGEHGDLQGIISGLVFFFATSVGSIALRELAAHSLGDLDKHET